MIVNLPSRLSFPSLPLLGLAVRKAIYYVLLFGLFFYTTRQLLMIFEFGPHAFSDWNLLWVLAAQNCFLFTFVLEAAYVYREDHSFSRASLVRLFCFNPSREADVFFWMYFSAVYIYVPISVRQSATLSSIFPLIDLGRIFGDGFWGGVGGGLVSFFFLSLCAFFIHILSHKIPALWELHKIHHSATELTTITGPREHLVFEFLHIFLFVAFFDTEGMLLTKAFAIRAFLNVLQHSQLDFRFGWLGRYVVSPHAHRIHHLNLPAYYNKNFGSDITLWDRLFGTFLYEAPLSATEMERNFGLSREDGEVGKGFFGKDLWTTTRKSLSVAFGRL